MPAKRDKLSETAEQRLGAATIRGLEVLAASYPMENCSLFDHDGFQIWPRASLDTPPDLRKVVQEAWRSGASQQLSRMGTLTASRMGDMGVFVRQSDTAGMGFQLPPGVLESLEDYLFIIDTDGLIIQDIKTSAAARPVGFEDFTGLSIWDILKASDAADMLRRLRNACFAQGVERTPINVSTRDATLHLRGILSRLDDAHCLVIAKDTTKERQLDLYQETIRRLLSVLPYRAYVVDRNGKYFVGKLPGQVETTVLGRSLEGYGLEKFQSDRELAESLSRIATVLGTGMPLIYRKTVDEHLLDVPIEVEVILLPFDPDHVLSLVRRIEKTDESTVNEGLRGLASMLIQNLADEFILVDLSGNIVEYVNQNPTNSEKVGRHYGELISEEEFRETMTYAAKAVANRQAISFVRRQPENGKLSYFDIRVLPFPNATVGILIKNTSDQYGEHLGRKAAATLAERLMLATPDWIRVLDRQGQFVQQFDDGPSKPFSPFGDLVGKTIFDVANRDSALETLERIQRVIRTGEVEQYFRSSTIAGTELILDIRIMRLDEAHVLSLTRDVTREKRLHEEVAKSEANQRAILSSVPDLLVVLSRDGTALNFHSAKVDHFYLNPGVQAGCHYSLLYPPQLCDVATKQLQDCSTEGDSGVDLVHCQIGGQMRAYELRTVTVDDQRFLQIWQDITDITLSNERSDRFFALSTECMLVCDDRWTILQASGAFCQFVGRSSREVHGKNFLEFVHPDDKIGCMREAIRAVKSRPTRNFVTRMISKDGEHRQFLWNADWDDKFQVSYSVGRDVTFELAQSWLLEKTQDLGKIGGWRLDLLKGTLWVTSGWKRIHGLPNGNPVTGAEIETLYGKPFDVIKERLVNKLIDQTQPLIANHPVKLPGAETIYTQTVAEMEVIRGVPTALFGTTRDITEQVRAQRSLANLNRSLEQRVKERTEALTLANEQLESFAHSVSHDLRAPLRAISSYSHFLEMDLGDEVTKVEPHLDKIKVAITRMDTLISDILRLARLGHQAVRRTRINLSIASQQIFKSLILSDNERIIRFEVEPGIFVYADEALTQIVLQNIIGNAIKFTEPRTEAVIRLTAGEHGKRTWVQFADNGVGFDPKYKEQVFKDFARLHRQDQFPGSGVGLGMVRRIIELHQGAIDVDAALGVGATFSLTFDPLISVSG